MLAPADSAGGGLGRALVVSRKRVLLSIFLHDICPDFKFLRCIHQFDIMQVEWRVAQAIDVGKLRLEGRGLDSLYLHFFVYFDLHSSRLTYM